MSKMIHPLQREQFKYTHIYRRLVLKNLNQSYLRIIHF